MLLLLHCCCCIPVLVLVLLAHVHRTSFVVHSVNFSLKQLIFFVLLRGVKHRTDTVDTAESSAESMPEKRGRPHRAIIRVKASRLLKTARAMCNGASGIAMGMWDADADDGGSNQTSPSSSLPGIQNQSNVGASPPQNVGAPSPPPPPPATTTTKSATPNSQDAHAIHRAVRGGKTDLVADLLKRGAPAGAKHDYGATPLHVAVKLGYHKIVALLLQNGAELNGLDGKGRTPLHLAAIYGQFQAAEVLLAAGADVGVVVVTSGYEHWALGFAARMGHISVLKLLVRHGADVNAASSRGLTALHYAAVRNQAAAIVALAEAGANIEATVDQDGGGGTTLHAASVMRCYDAALALLELGANLEARNAFGYSPLHGAARQGSKKGAVEMVDLLLRWGADETVVDRDGNKAIDLVGSSLVEEDECCHREFELERLRKLLENAPADRAWRRRGILALCRSFPERAQLSPVGDGAAAAAAAVTTTGTASASTVGSGSEAGVVVGSATGLGSGLGSGSGSDLGLGSGLEMGSVSGSEATTQQQGDSDAANGRRKSVATEVETTEAETTAEAVATKQNLTAKTPVTCDAAIEGGGARGADEFRSVLVKLVGLTEEGLFRDTVLFL